MEIIQRQFNIGQLRNNFNWAVQSTKSDVSRGYGTFPMDIMNSDSNRDYIEDADGNFKFYYKNMPHTVCKQHDVIRYKDVVNMLNWLYELSINKKYDSDTDTWYSGVRYFQVCEYGITSIKEILNDDIFVELWDKEKYIDCDNIPFELKKYLLSDVYDTEIPTVNKGDIDTGSVEELYGIWFNLKDENEEYLINEVQYFEDMDIGIDALHNSRRYFYYDGHDFLTSEYIEDIPKVYNYRFGYIAYEDEADEYYATSLITKDREKTEDLSLILSRIMNLADITMRYLLSMLVIIMHIGETVT